VTAKDANQPATFEGKILVPYPIESALSGVMKRVDEKSRLWYRRTFDIPEGWAGQRVLLHFGAVDWEAVVYLNGKELGSHRGGYDAFSFDITDALKSAGPQELVVAVFDPTEGGQPRGKQTRNPRGIMYTPTTGIWQTAWLEPVPQTRIGDLKITPDVDGGVLKLTVSAPGAADGMAVEAVALAEDKEVSRVSGKAGAEIVLPIKDARLWTPDTPFLYDLKVTLKKGEQTVDAVDSYFGMRKIALGKDDKGIQRLMLNGKFVFEVGPLDQGFWPDGLYTAPTDAALKYDIGMTKKLGFNATRKHVKVEPERWYYWCDKLGLLVWQDMPSAGNSTPELKQEFEKELRALVATHHNHPSIIMWVVFNEGWGQTRENDYAWPRSMVALVEKLDPSRLVNNASGWTDLKIGSVNDMHKYPGPGSPAPEADRAVVLGEFGGLGLKVDGHTWKAETWGYRGMADPAALTRQYQKLLARAYGLKDSSGLCAAIYTQITDVETECNGLMTYDRELVKGDLDKLAAANRGEAMEAIAPAKPVIPDAQQAKVTWRYTLDKPSDDWFKPAFDASAWKEGIGGFGTAGTPAAIVGTQWKSADIWLRREFTLEQTLKAPVLLMHHDEDAEVYINGVLAASAKDYISDYEEFDIAPAAKAALKPGKNTLAVHCHQTRGGQFIDVGIGEGK
jgi:beta-galactosidase/beta-glucuronidase